MLHRILPVLVLAALLGGCSSSFRSDNRAFDVVAAATQTHRGEIHAFSGRVIESREVPAGHELQIDMPTSEPTLVVIFPFRGVGILEDDHVWVLGEVTGDAEGINGFGGYQRAVLLRGIAYQSSRDAGCDASEEHLYNAWRDGTLQLGTRPEPVAASVVGAGR